MRMTLFVAGAVIAAAGIISMPVRSQQVTKQNVQGVTNFKRLETTVACAGVTKASAVPEIKKMGFASIINLRDPNDAGADVEAEASAAKAVGLRYYHLHFEGSKPDAAVVDKFLDVITTHGSDPAYIHWASGNSAATMWLIKRLVIDHWDVDRARAQKTFGFVD